MRTFEYSDGKSSKFWNIQLQGQSFTVTFGRIGSKGQTQIKQFPSEDRARAAHDKLIAEKLAKGYRETPPAPASAPAGGTGGPRTFEYSDTRSHKFWNIELKGRSFTLTYGRIGSKGQTQTR